jgi:hypothetical protein
VLTASQEFVIHHQACNSRSFRHADDPASHAVTSGRTSVGVLRLKDPVRQPSGKHWKFDWLLTSMAVGFDKDCQNRTPRRR